MRTIGRFMLVAGLNAALTLAVSAQTYRPAGGAGSRKTRRNNNAAYANSLKQLNATLQSDQQQVAAQATSLHEAQVALDTALNQATTDYHKTTDYVAAQKAVEEAAKEVEEARDAVMAHLQTLPDYTAAVAREKAARARLDDLKSSGADRDAIVEQSAEILRVSGDASRIERTALDGDPAYQDAMKKLGDGHAAQIALDDNFSATLKSDADITSLTQKRDDARSQLAAAQAKLRTDLAGSAGAAVGQQAATAGTGG